MTIPLSDSQPNLIVIAGPNGAGKSTFYASYLRQVGLRFVNADVTALEMGLDAYEAAELAEVTRRGLFAERQSFIFETVFSDPVGAKLSFLEEAVASGYNVVLCFIGLSRPGKSLQRVAVRVLEGGHNVPTAKITERYPRVMQNLRRALVRLPLVLVYDNDDLRVPHRFCLAMGYGKVLEMADPVPDWVKAVTPRDTGIE